MPQEIKVHLWISGHVQGVFYRTACKDEAERLKLSGWVKNLANGQVEAVFQGPDQAVQLMLDWCKKGPPMAHVNEVHVVSETVSQDLKGFRIVY